MKNCVWIDGSFNEKTGIYGGGGILFDQFGNRHLIFASDDEPKLAKMRNVAGELLGAKLVVELALKIGMKSLTIYHDYDGVAHWVTGKWRAKKEATSGYKRFMLDIIKKGLRISFKHVKGHSGNEMNELADKLAKIVVGIDI